ncbi:Uu.00g126560.m01.CDS01 [Anthostomella pinea]|uniref:2-methoxy-6-polyprenyl-1,4-benzoquinol methylase, mitochondrial n=1 Tax=Anthostomella pinea TaxID=933095 RepID=A0AAI8VI08_9PEZI|nr:Uu.00g126560.m01.CDS01 [Anthostomella pinea]
MATGPNVAIGLTVIFLVALCCCVAYKGKVWVKQFAVMMFESKKAQQQVNQRRARREERELAEEEESDLSPSSNPRGGHIHKLRSSKTNIKTMAVHPAGTGAMRAAVRTIISSRPGTTTTPHSFISRPRHVTTPTTKIKTFCTTTPARAPIPTSSTSSPAQPSDSSNGRTTHFGFQDGLSETEKTERVAGVFHSVAESYDRMNDLMSFGVHRIWKDHFVTSLNPGLSSATPPTPQRILDIAGGTGDIAFRMLHHAHVLNHNPNVHVTISDINASMLAVGKSRSQSLPASQQAALSFLKADATSLPPQIPSASIDLYTVAFGIRNFANIPLALREAHRVLKPGGVFACLEFSKVNNFVLDAAYKRWSFGAIPLIGQLVAGDRDSYQYLVESIERFPSQERFRRMIEDAGFVVGGRGYEDLTGGVAAIHKGMKPL